MTDTYLVLTTPTTTDVFPVRDIDRIWSDDVSLRVALRPVPHESGNATGMLACHIITDDPAEALRIATQALTDAIRTGQSVRADVGCAKLMSFDGVPNDTMGALDCVDPVLAKLAHASDGLEAIAGALDLVSGAMQSMAQKLR